VISRARSRTFALAATAVVATAALLGSAPNREPHPVGAPGAVRAVPALALRVARRFLTLYIDAYARPLDARGRAELRRIADPGIVDVLLGQPPEERRASGRLSALEMSELDEREWLAVASLRFRGLRIPATLVVARGAGGAWRVGDFEPGK